MDNPEYKNSTLPSTSYVEQLHRFATEMVLQYPTYEDTSNMSFTLVECSFLHWSTIGAGPNTENAKENAAQLMLDRLIIEDISKVCAKFQRLNVNAREVPTETDINMQKYGFPMSSAIKEKAKKPVIDLMCQRSPISVLQEITQQRKIQPPIYNIENCLGKGLPFVCTVKVMGITAKAYGCNKKDSKHRAAEKALETVGFKIYGNSNNEDSDDDSQISSSYALPSAHYNCTQNTVAKVKALESPTYRSNGLGFHINFNLNNSENDECDEGAELHQPQCSLNIEASGISRFTRNSIMTDHTPDPLKCLSTCSGNGLSLEGYNYKPKAAEKAKNLRTPACSNNGNSNNNGQPQPQCSQVSSSNWLSPKNYDPKQNGAEKAKALESPRYRSNGLINRNPVYGEGDESDEELYPTSYVGYLHKFASERVSSLPTYCETRHGYLDFVVECMFLNEHTVGSGTNMESAKQKAAQLMLERLIHTRNPISVLQDITQQRRIPRPVYNIDIGTSKSQRFVCTVEVMGITAKAFGCNKKDSKYHAAAKALEILGFKENTNPNDDDADDEPESLNYVGQLNEIASVRQFPYPTYQEHKSSSSNFVVECQFLNQSTVGTGPSKKSARQKAAQLMIDGWCGTRNRI
nr:unnamed protein product [Callosobruchus analis]